MQFSLFRLSVELGNPSWRYKVSRCVCVFGIPPKIFVKLKLQNKSSVLETVRQKVKVHLDLVTNVEPKSSVSYPDPGELKLPTRIEKVKKFHVLKCWMFSFVA
jgi:hypothetical protein